MDKTPEIYIPAELLQVQRKQIKLERRINKAIAAGSLAIASTVTQDPSTITAIAGTIYSIGTEVQSLFTRTDAPSFKRFSRNMLFAGILSYGINLIEADQGIQIHIYENTPDIQKIIPDENPTYII